MAVAEDQDAARHRSEPRDDPVGRAPTAATDSPPGQPSRKRDQPGRFRADLGRREALVLAVIPLGQVGDDHGLLAEARPAGTSAAPAATG